MKQISPTWASLFEIIWEQRAEDDERKRNTGTENHVAIFDMPTNNNAVLLE